MGCADIAITTDGDAAPVTPRPTQRPTKAADVATPRPTLRPTKGGIDWDCSGYSESCHRVDHNKGDAFKALGSTTNGKVGGIMFWAVNEGASDGPNGNGQTTGQNSVALANYAAAL